VFEWHKRLKVGGEGIKDDKRAGCPTTPWIHENVERVWKLVFANRLLGEKIMAEDLNVDGKTMRNILAEDLVMKKISAKIMPPVLSDIRNQGQLCISSHLSWP
jgi:hypothetical protein